MKKTLLAVAAAALTPILLAQDTAPEAVFLNAKVVTVDGDFSVREAFAVRGGQIMAVGTNAQMQGLGRAGRTQEYDLGGKMVLPGLIDSHVHAPQAAVFEYDHEVPDMETVADVLAYVAARTLVVPEGQWIMTSQVFITRLKEARYPTRAELDAVAPKHPVNFRTGPDSMLNSEAMKQCGFDRNFQVKDGGPGYLEKDASGEPTGLVRGLGRLIKTPAVRTPSEIEQRERLLMLMRDYNQAGFTAIADRGATLASIKNYQALRDRGSLTVRVALSQKIPEVGPLDMILGEIDQMAASPLRRRDAWLHLLGVKVWLDGGMLTGSAYMLQPWGRNANYGIKDDSYRGVLLIPPDRLQAMVRRAVQHGLSFTAHSVGDGAVATLLDAYEQANREKPIRDLRLGVCHSNFMTRESVEKAARLGVMLDIQPIWLYLDTRTLVQHFGYDRLRYFQPLKSILAAGGVTGGGSDHMLKIGDLRAINPYNPFLAMWTTITRRAKWYEGQLHPEEALTRRQAIEFYTKLNAYMLFWEKELGSIETGKRADFIVVDRDLLSCPEDDIKDAKVLQTWIEGRQVYRR